MLSTQTFKTVVKSTPLVSVDLLIKNEKKFLLGRRVNNPAKGSFFSIGGRIYKDEEIKDAIKRIANDELNFDLKLEPNFLGVFEHFYEDSVFKNISTHYINLAYKIEINEILELPREQHDEYRWYQVKEILESNDVHEYVKDYFRNQQS
ncbi:GDP-mannose mannosyl hydrolase [Gammaproteobacteria bacterium]|nr:GDP-mannose mannosyl hydrolase [Gammaproteobacteria bacterium]